MRIHFISIGGAVMHNLALALADEGNQVSGSDDVLFDPAFSRLKAKGLAPEALGWFPDKLHQDIELVILGMHARPDNPELARARELELKVMSFPEFMYSRATEKKRVVIAGSHGKTTSTAMLMYALKEAGEDFDYLVGSQIDGFQNMVHVSEKGNLAIYEGDEYLTSPADLRPKFLWYKPQIAMITGIAWDHINVFPTLEMYHEQFRLFLNTMEPDSTLIYFDGDEVLKDLANKATHLNCIPYNTPLNKAEDGKTYFGFEGKWYPLQIFGDHNLQNLEGIRIIASLLGMKGSSFLETMSHFGGTARRLELVRSELRIKIFRDFAHAPSKVKATLKAVRNQFPNEKVVAVLELHTFSSLNKEFLPQYRGALEGADEAIVYFNSETFKQKRMEPLDSLFVQEVFGAKVNVVNDPKDLTGCLYGRKRDVSTVFLLMSSGSFDGLNIDQI